MCWLPPLGTGKTSGFSMQFTRKEGRDHLVTQLEGEQERLELRMQWAAGKGSTECGAHTEEPPGPSLSQL